MLSLFWVNAGIYSGTSNNYTHTHICTTMLAHDSTAMDMMRSTIEAQTVDFLVPQLHCPVSFFDCKTIPPHSKLAGWVSTDENVYVTPLDAITTMMMNMVYMGAEPGLPPWHHGMVSFVNHMFEFISAHDSDIRIEDVSLIVYGSIVLFLKIVLDEPYTLKEMCTYFNNYSVNCNVLRSMETYVFTFYLHELFPNRPRIAAF